MSYQLLYSETSRKQIRKLHPQIKPIIKSKIEGLQENPFSGKWLEKELSGYLSMQAKRYRVKEVEMAIHVFQTKIRKTGYLELKNLPFKEGTTIEI